MSQNINVGLEGKVEEEVAAQRDAQACCLIFPCRGSLKTNPSKNYIKKCLSPKGDVQHLTTWDRNLKQLCLHGIVRSHLYLTEFVFVVTVALTPWTHIEIFKLLGVA